VTHTGGLVGGAFEMTDGREFLSQRASLLSSSVISVENAQGFKSDPPRPSDSRKVTTVDMRFQLVARLDRERGVPLDATGSGRCEFEGRRTALVSVQVRRLDGAEYEQAQKQAQEDWQEMPSQLDPIEFRRVQVAKRQTRGFQSLSDVKPGMPVVHFRCTGGGDYDGADSRYYMADVVEVGDTRTMRVKVRYRGSNEVLPVHVGQLYSPDR
jgi:hypothetical protein